MKKRILRSCVGLIVLGAFTLPSCEFIETCGYCELLEDDGNEITVITPEILYCNDSYLNKLNSKPTELLGVTTYWNCY